MHIIGAILIEAVSEWAGTFFFCIWHHMRKDSYRFNHCQRKTANPIQSTSTPYFNYLHFLFVTIFMDTNLFLPSADVNAQYISWYGAPSNRMSKVNDMLSQGIMKDRAQFKRTREKRKEREKNRYASWCFAEKKNKYLSNYLPRYWFACETSSLLLFIFHRVMMAAPLLPSIYLERVCFNQFSCVVNVHLINGQTCETNKFIAQSQDLHLEKEFNDGQWQNYY